MGDTGLRRYQRRGGAFESFLGEKFLRRPQDVLFLILFFDIVFKLTILFNIAVNTTKIVLFLKQSKIFLKYFQKRCNSQKMAIFTS